MLKATWNSLSLRSSLTISMLVTLLPLLVSAVLGYTILNNTVIADYQDVADRQQNQIAPIHALQLAILQAEIPLEEYLILGSQEKLADFRSLRQGIETTFPQLIARFEDDAQIVTLVENAYADWNAMNAEVTEMLAVNAAGNNDALAASLSRFDSLQAAVQDRLQAAHNIIEEIIEADYLDASRGFERSEWIAGISIAVSLLFMATGIYLFVQTILSSVEELVEGAERFSEGDREHRIEVHVPPELHKVAEEFNRMIGIIRVSEDKLAEQVRTDKLTGLLNRTTYDEVMKDAFDRLKRNGETLALLALDIDYFKRVNDTYGHDVGDQVLCIVAKVMQASVRTIDKVFRIGGEEFFILLPGADERAARTTAERIRIEVGNRGIVTAKETFNVTASLGFALAITESDTPDSLKKNADVALYRAKGAGRDRVIGFSDSEGVEG